MTITIPAELVPPVRDGAYLDLRYQVEEAGALVEPRERRDIGAGVASCFDRASGARELLDAVGWIDHEDPRAVDVDPYAHREALIRALHLRIHAEWAVQDDEQASAEQRTEAKGRMGALAHLVARVEECD